VTVYRIDPIRDTRWGQFLQRHPYSSIFHTPGWLETLRRTYGYKPFALTTSPPDRQLANGIVLCRVSSWLTGRRIVSLPFSDHCEPLVDHPEDLEDLVRALQQNQEKWKWDYVELRPLRAQPATPASFELSETYYFHRLDLRPTADELFRNFHRDSTQRKIRRAEREHLTYEEGRSDALLSKFYQLLLLTRRRHRLLPPPRLWFRNLIDCLKGDVKIRVASRQGQPVASILTLRFKQTLVYKYGCSNARFHNLGGMHLLLWRAIQEAKCDGLLEFDLGRSDRNNEGLATFKDRWGAARSTLRYWHYPARQTQTSKDGWQMQVAKRIFAHLPDRILTMAGKLLYRHVG